MRCFTSLIFTAVIIITTSPAHAQSCTPIQTQELLANDGADTDWFGYSVAIDSNTAVVGAMLDDDNGADSGSVYLFDITTGQQLFKLLPDDGAGNDLFGCSVSVSGSTAVIGAFRKDDNGPESGAAYLFDTTTGLQIDKLLPNDGAPGAYFGHAVSISGNTVIIGASLDDNHGSAYLFDTSGAQIAKLVANDGNMSDFFGSSVDIDGNTAIVGARLDDDNGSSSGSAYLFDATTGQQLFKLLADDGEQNDEFGSVAINATTAIVGAQYDDDNGSDSGSAYLFDTTTGQQLFKLLPDDGAPSDRFGRAVAITGPNSNQIAIVCSYFDDDNGANSGAAYLFDVNTGQQIAKFVPDDPFADDYFGYAVAINGSTIIVSAVNHDETALNAGAAYIFNYDCTPCLELSVINLIAGQQATFNLINGTPGVKAVTVYGLNAGTTVVNNIAGYCATFGINGITQNNVIGGLNQTFNTNGKITFNINIPSNASGMHVFFQSAMHNTCPNECMSNLIDTTIQ